MITFNAAISAINSARSYNYNGIDNVPYDGYQAVLPRVKEKQNGNGV